MHVTTSGAAFTRVADCLLKRGEVRDVPGLSIQGQSLEEASEEGLQIRDTPGLQGQLQRQLQGQGQQLFNMQLTGHTLPGRTVRLNVRLRLFCSAHIRNTGAHTS